MATQLATRAGRRFDHPALALLIAFLVCFGAEALSAAFAHANMAWYLTLAKPSFMPPAIVFPFAWTGAFALLALAVWQFWRAPGKAENRKLGLVWFGIVLVLNVVASIAHFALRSPMGGVLGMLPLLVAAVVTIVLFDRSSRPAALLVLPYLLWIALLTAVNMGTWILNSGA